MYLNSDFEGGHTYFTDGTSIAPKAGRIVFFDGKYHYHGVSPIYNNRYTIAAWYKKQWVLKKINILLSNKQYQKI